MRGHDCTSLCAYRKNLNESSHPSSDKTLRCFHFFFIKLLTSLYSYAACYIFNCVIFSMDIVSSFHELVAV